MSTSRKDLEQELKKMAEDYDLEQELNRAFLFVQTEQELKKLSDELALKELEEKMDKLLKFEVSERHGVDELSRMLEDLTLRSSHDQLRERILKLREKLDLLEGKIPRQKQKMPSKRSVLTQRSSKSDKPKLASRIIPSGIVGQKDVNLSRKKEQEDIKNRACLLYTSPSPRD